eukprot:1142912-Pelagomonas_calceolata.AAC.8
MAVAKHTLRRAATSSAAFNTLFTTASLRSSLTSLISVVKFKQNALVSSTSKMQMLLEVLSISGCKAASLIKQGTLHLWFQGGRAKEAICTRGCKANQGTSEHTPPPCNSTADCKARRQLQYPAAHTHLHAYATQLCTSNILTYKQCNKAL